MKTPHLESERLYYEPVSLKHCTDRYLAWLTDGEVNLYLESGREPYPMEKLVEYVEQIEKRPDVAFWAIHLKENGKHIGNIKIEGIHPLHRRGEYGIMMGDKDEWGKGYAREATLAIADYCFSKLDLKKITLGVVSDNTRAVELYQRCGFVTEGVYKHHGFYNGKWCDMMRMALFNPGHQH